MNLSTILTTNVSKNLKFNTFLFEEDKKYNDNLSEFLTVLSQISEEDTLSKKIWKHESKSIPCLLDQDFVIMYIITITFSKSNTMIHLADSTGNIKWFCSSGSINVAGKQKKHRRSVVLKLILFLFKQANFLLKKPVALHLNNVSSYQTFIINKLKKEIFIKIIKSFNQIPYNGCRKKKIRRKKYMKTFK